MTDTITELHRLYVPLRYDEIRILVLSPSRKFQTRLKGRFETQPLNSKRLGGRHNKDAAYEAVSYVWVEPSKKESVLLHGSHFAIDMSLGNALRHFRYATTERRLWVDIICINEGDSRERSKQIQLMGQIFLEATMVIVWLGDADDAAFHGLSGIKDTIAKVRSGSLVKKMELSQTVRLTEKFLSMSWFRRGWTFQEVALASNVILCNGFDQMHWETLQTAIELYDGKFFTGSDGKGMDAQMDVIIDMQPARCAIEYREVAQRIGRLANCSLHDLIRHFHNQSSADPRDRIYTLLGITNDKTVHQPSVPVDYDVLVEALYQTFYLEVIQLKETLDVLLWPWSHHPTLSWVNPQYNDRSAQAIVQPQNCPEEKPPMFQFLPFRGNRVLKVLENGVIRFSRFIIDEVEVTTDTNNGFELPFPRSWTDLFPFEMLLIMLFKDCKLYKEQSKERRREILRSLRRNYHPDQSERHQDYSTTNPKTRTEELLLLWLRSLTRGRRLFQTLQWYQIGLAPSGAQKGDGQCAGIIQVATKLT